MAKKKIEEQIPESSLTTPEATNETTIPTVPETGKDETKELTTSKEVPTQIPIMGDIQKAEIKERAALIQENVSIDGRIISFLTSRNNGHFIRLNDFLKSLYPISKNNEPIEWQKQTNMKSLRLILQKIANERQVQFSNNSYQLLGKPYWPDDKTGITHYHHLGTVNIEAKLA